MNDLGTDYNGFNLVYVPGGAVVQTNHIIRILTDVGLVGEYAGGSAADYAILPSFAHYLIGKHALERERIYTDVKRALRQVARIGLTPVDIALWDLAGKYYQTPIYRLLGGYKERLPCYASTYRRRSRQRRQRWARQLDALVRRLAVFAFNFSSPLNLDSLWRRQRREPADSGTDGRSQSPPSPRRPPQPRA